MPLPPGTLVPATPAAPTARQPGGPALPTHFHALDALRGVAALAVVFWHWQHFFLGYQGAHLPDFAFSREPLYAVFGPLYTDGWRAVELFFSLSGFIFTWLYADPIARRAVKPRAFAVLRFSRLYPLHLATLLLVAAGQLWAVRATGMPFVYQWNDAYHFALQLAFAGNWGLERGDSFNGPTWSVSVEILLYVLFFLTSRLGCRRWWQLGAVAAGGFALLTVAEGYNNGLVRVGTGVMCFYAGGLAFLAYRALWERRPPRAVLWSLTALAAVLWAVVPLNFSGRLVSLWQGDAPHPAFTVAGHDVVFAVLWRAAGRGRHGFELLVFPLTILTLALWESARGPLAARLGTLGDISYASYLIHFPLQLAFFGVAVAAGAPRSVFYEPAVLLAFFVVLVPLSLAVYRGFELPAQRRLRARLLGSTRRPRPVVAEEAGDGRPAVAA